MDFQFDESCKNCNFCKMNVGFQILNEIFLNIASRTQGVITRCQGCNMYIEKDNKNGRGCLL